jgi:hypothetical protein
MPIQRRRNGPGRVPGTGRNGTRPDGSFAHGSGPAVNRSAITNGSLFMSVPSSVSWVRRMKDLLELHENHLGGRDQVSAPQAAICRRISVLIVELEVMEHKFAQKGTGAKPAELDLYARVCGQLRRLLETIGLRQEARDITPPFVDYAAREARIQAAIRQQEVEDAR